MNQTIENLENFLNEVDLLPESMEINISQDYLDSMDLKTLKEIEDKLRDLVFIAVSVGYEVVIEENHKDRTLDYTFELEKN